MKKHNRYKIIPTEKKSIIVTTTYKTGDPSSYHEGDKVVTREDTFRWGYAVIEASKKDIPKNEKILVTDFELVENDYDEVVAEYWEYPDDMSDEEKENIENTFNDVGEDGLAKLGWHYFDSEDKILPPFKIEKSE